MGVTNPPIANKPFVLATSMSTYYGVGDDLQGIVGAPASAAWPSANRAIYVPIYLDQPCTVVKLWIAIGATGATGNVDVGIYNAAYARIVSAGSTAQAAANIIQEFDIADTALTRGVYFLGMSASSGVATYFASSPNVATFASGMGVLQEAAALPLPATATPVAIVAGYVPLIGIAFRTLVA